jgi:hypothetical protein
MARVQKTPKKTKAPELVPETVAIRKEISAFFSTLGKDGNKIGTRLGVYVFYDYFGEPIYVGQSEESLGARIGRHLTNQRGSQNGVELLALEFRL